MKDEKVEFLDLSKKHKKWVRGGGKEDAFGGEEKHKGKKICNLKEEGEGGGDEAEQGNKLLCFRRDGGKRGGRERDSEGG